MILLLIFLLIIIMFYRYQAKWQPVYPEFYPANEIVKIGHRGAPILAPENTIESFTKAFEAGIKGIELDIQLSKDGKLVVFHDWELTNITGSLISVEDMDYSEILDSSRAKNYEIPLLSDVLDICPVGKFINIEIKSKHCLNTPLVKKVVKLILEYKIEKNVIISSFNPYILQCTKKLAPEILTAYLWSSEYTSFLFNSPIWIWMCRPDGFHININNVDEKIINWARKKNLAVLAFTVNNLSDLTKVRELGLDGIFTDDPYLKLNPK